MLETKARAYISVVTLTAHGVYITLTKTHGLFTEIPYKTLPGQESFPPRASIRLIPSDNTCVLTVICVRLIGMWRDPVLSL